MSEEKILWQRVVVDPKENRFLFNLFRRVSREVGSTITERIVKVNNLEERYRFVFEWDGDTCGIEMYREIPSRLIKHKHKE